MTNKTMADLKAALPHILSAPKDRGVLRMIVARPVTGQRTTPQSANLSLSGGVEGDHWSKGCWLKTEDGAPHPDVQICLMTARCIEAIAGDPANWPAAGDNLFVDINLSPENISVGDRLEIGSVLLEMTAELHNGCQSFIDRYGRDAVVFVNTGPGKEHRLRGRYARVVRDGIVSVEDPIIVHRQAQTVSAAE